MLAAALVVAVSVAGSIGLAGASTATPRGSSGTTTPPAGALGACLKWTSGPVSSTFKSNVCDELIGLLQGIGSRLGLDVIKPDYDPITDDVKLVFAKYPDGNSAMDTRYSATSQPCEITIYPGAYSKGTTSVNSSMTGELAHEVAHCYQDVIFYDYEEKHKSAVIPNYLIEGSAEYVGDAYLGHGSNPTEGFWSDWLTIPKLSLLKRSYSAFAWYFLADEINENNLLSRIADAWKAWVSGGNAAYITAIGGDTPAVEKAWAPSLLNEPQWGPAWSTPGVDVPRNVHPKLIQMRVSQSAFTTQIAPWAAYLAHEQTVPNGLVEISDSNGYASVHDPNENADGFADTVFCVGTAACQDTNVSCSAGGVPVALTPLSAPFTLAANGDGGGAQLSIVWRRAPANPTTPVTLPNVNGTCTPKRTAVVSGYSEGDPHLGTLNGLTYDFQAAGEYTLVRSTSGGLDVQVRQQPAAHSESVTWDTAVAMLAGSTHVEVDPGATPTVLVNGSAVHLKNGNLDQLSGGSTLTLDGGGDVLLTWPDGAKADVNVDSLGESVVFTSPSGLVSNLQGLLTADVTTAKTPQGEEALIGGNGKTFVLNPNTQRGFRTLYRSFAPTWQVSGRNSLFTYSSGKSASSYLVSNFPSKIATTTGLGYILGALEHLEIVEQTCRAHGITNGALLTDCVMDGIELGRKNLNEIAAAAAHVGSVVATAEEPPASAAPPTPTKHTSGLSWTAPVKVDSSTTGGLVSVSCATTTFCVAVDDIGNAFTYNGSSWSKAVAIDPSPHAGSPDETSSVSCPSVTFCVVGDHHGRFVQYNGSSWSAPIDVDTSNGDLFLAVSCASSTACEAVDGASTADAIDYNGTAWSKPTVVGANADVGELTDVSCPTASFCLAVDGADNAATWNGTSWTTMSIDTQSAAVESEATVGVDACASASFCVAGGTVNNVGYLATSTGSSWSANDGADPKATDFAAASCASGPFCVVIDSEGNATEYDNGSWSKAERVEPLDLGAFPTSVSCPTSSFCMAVDSDGNALHTTN